MTATEQRPPAAPARRGRRPGRGSGGSRLLNGAIGLLLVAGAVGLQGLHLSENDYTAPLTYTGDKGANVDAGRFTVRLNSFAVAKAIRSSSKTVTTDNLFLIVNASAKSSLKPYHLGQPVLLTGDERRFAATDRVDSGSTLAAAWVQPDIWVTGAFFFEVPASVLPGARIVFGLPPSALVEPYQPEVEVDLGLDEEGARKLAAQPQDVYPIVKK
ncbi:hypothetical protein [Nonomuraea cavernae]|uniref:DUF4352 domain-containing protein n=1 Tax=Nonomuraea cavernae TaxID=2045107 RepID=A0A917YYW0_9ACTN|nr:hypothetical protein [Nonomuraea cavernae]MCA2187346.1 hypothetical protein [Nonomuraea cavernae]GGO68334.1 hypothetical protein GCM10012289_26860 [Nonomuraea cavernae]